MAKDKLTDYDSTASGNLDVGGISVAEGMLPSGVNNAIRELMSHQADAFGAGTPLYVDQTNNQLGIGTSSPDSGYKLDVAGNVVFGDGGGFDMNVDGTRWQFSLAGSERMRLDSSGNLLHGKTVQSIGTVGVTLVNGQITATADGADAIRLNRKSSDGSIIDLRKDDATVGAIGAVSGVPYFYGSSGFRLGGSIQPITSTGALSDNTTDIGQSNARFDDIYATNGTIQTSDQNEKQQIAALTDAEITAAKAISQLFKTFKWNSAVEAKGDAARTHAGVIAQDVQAAMTAAGLDAGDYAFFISSTWWETQTEVPAVEAVEAVLDEDGNVVTEAVEAVAAYTRTDTYDTAEEAPESATERTRLGIRYPELIAFVGAATEQRLANIETRLEALEAN